MPNAASAPDSDSLLRLEVDVAASGWDAAVDAAAAVAERAAQAAFQAAFQTGAADWTRGRDSEAAVRLADDAEVRALNRDYRDADRPTNVLSFPALDDAERRRLPAGAPMLLGDVVVALETALAEAGAQGKSPADHLSHLVVHGMLHLLGYDHLDDDEATVMETLETEILSGLGIADPYGAGAP